MDYITLAEAKTWLGITDTASDAILSDLISVVSEAVDGWCETTFGAAQTKTNELHDGRRQDTLVPKGFPVIGITQIVLGVAADGSGGSVLGTDMYQADESVVRFLFGSLPQVRGYVRVDYTWGYASVPLRVKQAVKIGVEGYWRMRTRQAVGITSRSKEGESINYARTWSQEAGLPAESVGLLKEFRMLEWPSGPGTSMATRNT